jgi:hypothetical protein
MTATWHDPAPAHDRGDDNQSPRLILTAPHCPTPQLGADSTQDGRSTTIRFRPSFTVLLDISAVIGANRFLRESDRFIRLSTRAPSTLTAPRAPPSSSRHIGYGTGAFCIPMWYAALRNEAVSFQIMEERPPELTGSLGYAGRFVLAGGNLFWRLTVGGWRMRAAWRW